MILDARGRPFAEPAPTPPPPLVHSRVGDWEGRTMFIEIIKPWLHYQPGEVVESAPNEAEWLVRTGRGKEVEEKAHGESAADSQAD